MEPYLHHPPLPALYLAGVFYLASRGEGFISNTGQIASATLHKPVAQRLLFGPQLLFAVKGGQGLVQVEGLDEGFRNRALGFS